MTQCIVVRHGYSKSNEKGCFTGQTDIPLSDLGIAQARQTAAYLRNTFQPTHIYSSDLVRALQTAQPAADAFKLPIVTEKDLREINGGEWEEKTPEQILRLYPRDYTLWLENIGLACCTGGESMAQVQTRAVEALRKIARQCPDECVLIFTHAGVIRALQCAWCNVPLQNMKDIPWVPNASISIVQVSDNAFAVQKIGFADHLQGMQTNLPKNM